MHVARLFAIFLWGCLIVSYAWPTSSLAQSSLSLDPDKRISQYVHDTWSTDEGLPQNSVSSILQSADGYLWFGTEEGLVRFDGNQFVTFDKRNAASFGVNDVVALLETSEGHIWAGTRGAGIVVYNGNTFSTIDKAEGLDSPYITSLFEDLQGDKWIGTYGGGLTKSSDGSIQNFGDEAGFAGEFISVVAQDNHNIHWVGTEQGLYRLVGDNYYPFQQTPLDSAFVTTVFIDKNDKLWVTTRDHGIYHVLNDSLKRVEHPAFAEGYVTSVLEDSAGSLWLGMTQGKLVRFTGNQFEQIESSKILTEGDIIALFEDREGSIWLGTRGDGLHRLRNEKFTPFSESEGLASNRAYSIFEQESKGIWVGTAAGLSLINNNSSIPFPQRDSLAGKEILSVYGDGGPGLWVGTYGEGLFYIQDSIKRQFLARDGLPSNNIFAITTDKDGTLWIGTDAGIAIYDGLAFKSLTTSDGLPSPFITAIEKSTDGSVWIGTYDAGLVRYANGHFTQYTTENGLSGDGVLALYEDMEGVLWVGMYGGGLNRLELDQITSYSTRNGLFNDNVYVILEDNTNNLWMTCNKGIFRVDKSELKKVARGEATEVTSIVYGKYDGLRSAEATGGQQPAGWKSNDGKLWFPTIAGVVSIDPTKTHKNELAPPVVIEQFVVDGEESHLGSELTLQSGSDKLRFQFTAPSLVIPEHVQFQYFLEGIDSDWTKPDSRREAFYTNLPPGNYTFKVRASNNDGVWNEKGASIGFYLEPLFYQTLWFKCLAVFLALLVIFVIYRIRIQQLKARQEALEQVVEERTRDLRMEKEKTEQSKKVIEAQADKLKELDRFKTRFFANISHEFRTPLTMIIGPLENTIGGMYGPIGDVLGRQVNIMLRNAQRLLRLINQLLDLSKLEAGKMALRAQLRNIVQFLEGVLLSCTPLAEKKNITLNFNSERNELGLYYEPDKLEKIFFNLLSNALKFTPEGGSISFNLFERPPSDAFKEGALEIQVVDTGRGIPAEDLAHVFDRFHQVDGSNTREFEGTGIGLALVHELVMLHNGAISVSSEIGKGTTFSVKLPLGDNHLTKEQITNDILGDDVIQSQAPGVITELANESVEFDHEDTLSTLEDPFNGPDPMIGSKVVLIVDDNDDVREYVSGILSEHFVVHTAIDGVDGLEKVAELDPDLVISDVMMPRMDGNELCRRIKQNLDYDHIPVILMTARATNELKIEGLEMGADDYIAKPFNARELLIRARNLMILRHQEKELKSLNENLELKVAEQLSQLLSERLKYEEELMVAKERAETSSKLKTNILDNVNHEFRTPLAGIMGSAEILEMEASESMKEFVTFIKQSALRLQNTLDGVVELSSIESETINLDFDTINFTDKVKDMVDRYKGVATNKGLQFFSRLGTQDIYVNADDKALSRMLDQLVDNAIKFTHQGQINIDLLLEKDAARLVIKDTGIGISEDFLPKLYDPFVQESDGIARSYEGIGVGMAISKRLAELMDITLSVESTKNEGSAFTLKIPVHKSAQSTHGIADEDAA